MINKMRPDLQIPITAPLAPGTQRSEGEITGRRDVRLLNENDVVSGILKDHGIIK
jgi:hypothetical protein